MDWNQVRSFIQNGRRNLKICMEKHETGVGRKETGE
jgi:RNA polymerase sigma-70 factor (ECF subfamily)